MVQLRARCYWCGLAPVTVRWDPESQTYICRRCQHNWGEAKRAVAYTTEHGLTIHQSM